MNFLLIVMVTVIEILIIYRIRYVYSRRPSLAIVITIATIFLFYALMIISVNKFVRAYAFNFATINLIFLTIMLSYMLIMTQDQRNTELNTPTDFLIVLGNKCVGNRLSPILMGRLDKAYMLYRDFQIKPKIIVSGGKGSATEFSEAYLMAQYLMEKGIPKRMILVESKSQNTMQNLEFSAIKIREIWQKDSRPRVIIVTSDYHIPRTKFLTSKLRLKVNFEAVQTVKMLKWPAMFREFTAIIWYHRYTLVSVLGMDFLFSLSMCM